MKKTYPILVLLIFCLSAFGQQQTPTPDASPNLENDVVKITTKLVQMDVIVVDKDGKQVLGLTADDFEILQDGKPQPVSNLSYVNTEILKAASQPKPTDKGTVLPPPTKVTTATAGRIITFVVDDGNCSVSRIGVIASREGVEKFIREQMQPNDLVAIYRTRAGTSLFQQYTNDKTLLLKAAKKIQWYPSTGSCSSNDGSFFEAVRSNTLIKRSVTGTTTETVESDSDKKAREHVEDAVRNNQVIGALGVVRYIVRGLQRVPGRKIVFLMSDGIPIRGRSGELLSAVDVLRDLTDLANRSSVVFNTIDPRGVIDEGTIEARDEVYGEDDVNATDRIRSDRAGIISNSRDGLAFLARETGGEFTHDQNFLDGPIRKDLARETGYYLIAYEPPDESFKGKKFNKIQVKVKRPDLKVISRAGFISAVDQTASVKRRSENSELYEAIATPLPTAGINLQLTAFFVNSPETGNIVRSLIHLDGNEITFVDDAPGLKKAVFDVVAVTMDEKTRVVDEFTRTHTFKVKAEAMPYIMQNGIVYSTDVAVKKPGIYNFRVAVRDAASKLLGSSSQIVEIPDLKKSKVFISGLTIAALDADGKFDVPTAVKPENAFSLTASGAVPAIRRFRRSSVLAYSYTVYNAQLDKTTIKPKISVQVNLYRNGQIVTEGLPQESSLDKQADWSRISDFAYLRLSPKMEPGDYTLQVIVKDLLAGGKTSTSSQWIDFELVDY